jgi:hypothetical protein
VARLGLPLQRKLATNAKVSFVVRGFPTLSDGCLGGLTPAETNVLVDVHDFRSICKDLFKLTMRL